MSLYCEIETEFSDEDALVAALEEMGWKGKVERYARAARLQGYEGQFRDQRANLIIRRQHVQATANDMGFVKGPDGRFTLIVSEYDRGTRYGDAWLNQLKGHYLDKAVPRSYAAKRYRLAERTVSQDGNKIRLRLVQ